MENVKCNALKVSVLLATAMVQIWAPVASARMPNGGGVTGGGDVCENRIKIIREDIINWIKRGGPKNGLELPNGVSIAQYSQGMLAQIEKAKFKCVGPGDEGYPVEIRGTPKVCRFDLTQSESKFRCDYLKFNGTSETDQYINIHHEYAGLAGIEKPNEDDSKYGVSNQLSLYLADKVEKRLALKPKVPAKGHFVCAKPRIVEAFNYGKNGNAQFIDLSLLNFVATSFQPNLCLDTDFPAGQLKFHNEILDRRSGRGVKGEFFTCMHYGQDEGFENLQSRVFLTQQIDCKLELENQRAISCSVTIDSGYGTNELSLTLHGDENTQRLPAKNESASAMGDKFGFAMACFRDMVRSLPLLPDEGRALKSGVYK